MCGRNSIGQLRLTEYRAAGTKPLTTTTDFIAELVRAANQTDKLSSIEVGRLLERSVRTIRELRSQIGIIPFPGKDALIYVETVAVGASRVPEEEWHYGLLQAAEMIRDLHIVLASGTKVRLT